ncbi:MAG: hypothetical protein P4N60_19260 [Verrucomicrobiae bacterium]|nr:hypothetical protein [Verrucomicrobiae bacterium]
MVALLFEGLFKHASAAAKLIFFFSNRHMQRRALFGGDALQVRDAQTADVSQRAKIQRVQDGFMDRLADWAFVKVH